MLCIVSLIFLFIVMAQLETGNLGFGQAIFYGGYGVLMFYYTSIPYWTENQKRRKM